MKKSIFSFFTTMFLLFFTTNTLAQSVEVPEIKVGDSWNYAIRDGWGKNLNDLSFTVTEVSVEKVKFSILNSTESSPQVAFYSKAGNIISDWNQEILSNDIGLNIKESCYLNFPFQVGKSWSCKVQKKIPAGAIITEDAEAKILSYENIEVLGSKFMAYKVRYSSYFRRSDIPGQGRISVTYWYAPEVGRYVKQEFLGKDFQNNTYLWTIYELKSHKR